MFNPIEALARIDFLEQVNDANVLKLVTCLEASFSALATTNPKLALEIIEQLNDKVDEIKSLAEERAGLDTRRP